MMAGEPMYLCPDQQALSASILPSFLPPLFVKEATKQLSESTVLLFCSFLDADSWQQHAKCRWDATSETVRQAVDDYLVQHLRSKVRDIVRGFSSSPLHKVPIVPFGSFSLVLNSSVE